jgi:sarcosine oxidase subunit beta
MTLYSIDFFQNWDFECGYEPRGYLFFATDEKHLDYLKRNVEKQKSLGVKAVEIVDTKTISEMVKGLNCEDICGGSFGANDGFINPLGVLEGFMSKATANGAEILTETKVLSIETKDGKIVGVETDKGRIEAEKIVLCSGAWARDLAKTAGVELPIEPLKRQIVWAKSKTNLQEDLPMVIDLGSGFHFRPAKDSRDDVLFAYPDADEQPSFDTNFDQTFIDKVYERAKHRAPFLTATTVVREKCRAGLYENTPDHHAIISGCEIDNLYFCNGFSGHGVMHSPAAGRAVAEIILDGEAKFLDASCLNLTRFATGKLLHETAFI